MLTNGNNGFTLIEVLVSITILLTVAFLPLSIIAQYLVNNELTQENVKAQFLSQEIIEFVRYERDTHFINPASDSNWFLNLYNERNIFANCVIGLNDLELINNGDGSGLPYCVPSCLSGTTLDNSCSSEGSSFVWGIKNQSSPSLYGVNENTCDGNHAKSNGEFTITLNLAVPDKDLQSRYAIISPCISWENSNGNISKIKLHESVFEWVIRN